MKLSQTPEAMELKRQLREAYGLPPREPPKAAEPNAAELAWEERVRAMSLERLQRVMDQGQEAYLERLRELEALRTCHRGPGDADWNR
jgi:hypothetical protein